MQRLPRGIVGIALALAACLSVLMRIPFLSVPLITDEAGYAYTAHWMARGLTLYRDLWFDRPQGIFLVYGAQMALLGQSTEALRLGAALCNAATVVAVFALAAALESRRAGLLAALLFAVASASPVVEGFTANGELYMNLPVVLCLALAARRRWLLAGLVLAASAMVKPTALPTALPPLAVLLAWSDGSGPTVGSALRHAAGSALRLAAGALLGFIPFVAHGLASDPGGYVYAVLGFRVQAHSAFSVGESVLGELLNTAPSVTVALLPLVALAAGVLVRGCWRTRFGAVGAAYLAGALAGAALGGYWYWHYYVGVVPALALLGALALGRLPSLRRAARTWRGAALAASALVALAFTLRTVGVTPEETSWRLYQRPAYLAAARVAAYLRAHTTDDQTIYAAFAEADLYHLSQRRSAGRHLYWTEINRVPGALDDVLGALDDPRRRPAYVVAIDRDLEVPGRAAAFWEHVARYYEPEATVGGFTLFRARPDAA